MGKTYHVGFDAVRWHPQALVHCWHQAFRPRHHLRRRATAYLDRPADEPGTERAAVAARGFAVVEEVSDFLPDDLERMAFNARRLMVNSVELARLERWSRVEPDREVVSPTGSILDPAEWS